MRVIAVGIPGIVRYCSGCPVFAALFWLSCLGRLVGAVLSCPVLDAPPWFPHPGCVCHGCVVLAVPAVISGPGYFLSNLSCPDCPCPGCQCPGCPFLAVYLFLSYSGCPDLPVLSCLRCSESPVLTVLICAPCLVPLFLCVLFWLS
jgi:hypothetical protein